MGDGRRAEDRQRMRGRTAGSAGAGPVPRHLGGAGAVGTKQRGTRADAGLWLRARPGDHSGGLREHGPGRGGRGHWAIPGEGHPGKLMNKVGGRQSS